VKVEVNQMREPTVAVFANRRVITAVPATPFRKLVGTMIAHDLDALPVIDLTGRL
jgi:CBS-domain-containing membrane protein